MLVEKILDEKIMHKKMFDGKHENILNEIILYKEM